MRVGHGVRSLVDAGAAGGPRRGPKALSTPERVQWQAIAWFRVRRVPRDLSAVGIRRDARAGPVSRRGGRLRWQVRPCPAHEGQLVPGINRSEEHTSELPSLMRISYAVFCLKKKKHITLKHRHK